MSLTMVEAHPGSKTGPITIRPYFDSSMANMGLENYGMSLYEGVYHEEQLACIERNGIKRYVTGLNEFAPEVKLIRDDDTRNAIIKEIRVKVAQLERELAANVLKEDDPEFWNKVVLLKPDNDEFWGKISLRCGNDYLHLDPVKDPYDLIKLTAIEAGGFSIVAKSLEDARSRPVPPRFYLDKLEETVVTKTELKKLKNKALSELDKLYNKTPKKLFLIAKVLDSNSINFKKGTSNDTVYDVLDTYINGNSHESNQRRAAQSFLDVCSQDMETLTIRGVIKDATFLRFISTKPDGFIYHTASGSLLGRNPSDILEFFKNPLNQAIYEEISEKVQNYLNS